MFRLSKKADYGLIALKHLAQHTEESVSAREIARSTTFRRELLAKDPAATGSKGIAGLAAGHQWRLCPGARSGQDLDRGCGRSAGRSDRNYSLRTGVELPATGDCSVRDPLMKVQGKGGSGSGRHLDLRIGDELG